MRAKKGKKRTRSIRAKNPVRTEEPIRTSWANNPVAIVLGVICIAAVVAMIAARQPSLGSEVGRTGEPPETNAPSQKTMKVAAALDAKKNVATTSATTTATKTPAAAPTRNRPAVESMKAMVESSSEPSASEATPNAPTAEATRTAEVRNVAPVTITGCVEEGRETFWLKDASGPDAPTSRSWRSGFLKKRPSPIELVDATNTLRLRNYVGQRVAATGVLMKREMRARSLQSVATSCS